MEAGHRLVGPRGHGGGVQRHLPEAYFVQLAGEVGGTAAAAGAAQVEGAVRGGVGHERGAAGDTAHQGAVFVGSEHAIGMDQGDLQPLARREGDGDAVHAVAVIVPDPDVVAAAVVGPVDAKGAGEVVAHNELAHFGQGRRAIGGCGPQPDADALGLGPVGADQASHPAQHHVIIHAVQGQRVAGAVLGHHSLGPLVHGPEQQQRQTAEDQREERTSGGDGVPT
ncbi:hypothetical protein RY27_06050 [Litorilinea aerophila]|nr:hypothetical protein RY27_06050 [Litorilinea aerophila]